MNIKLLAKLRHHVTGAIQRGEAVAIIEKPAPHVTMKTKSALQSKAAALLNLDRRRKAHHAALSSLHDTLLPTLEEHEQRGLKMWRKLRRIETMAHDAATAQCNGAAYNGQPYRGELEWVAFCLKIQGQVTAIFGFTPDNGPLGYFLNCDPRGAALKIENPPEGMYRDFVGDGILAAEITL